MSGSLQPLRIAVLGAGPIGIEAALYGAALGHDVIVFEQGAVGNAVGMWGHVTLFSPWRMNISPLGAKQLDKLGWPLSDLSHCPNGNEFVEKYLLPLSQCALLKGRLRLFTRVVAIGREGLLKGDLVGQAARAAHRFRLLIEDKTGEHIEFADAILDCTGTYLYPNPIGDGGIYAPGERWLTARLVRHLPDVLGSERRRFARRKTLLIGDGLSAATAAIALCQLCAEEKSTQVTWAVRRAEHPPYQPLAGDPLPARARLLAAANRVAEEGSAPCGPGQNLRFLSRMVVDAMAAEGHQLRVRLHSLGKEPVAVYEELFDEVVGLTGYGPDRSLYEQLQIHECYASFGPMKLAATLIGASEDCLAQSMPGRYALNNPEPRFFVLGAKSYARNSAFLLQIGHAQVRGVYALLHNNEGLDLYAQD